MEDDLLQLLVAAESKRGYARHFRGNHKATLQVCAIKCSSPYLFKGFGKIHLFNTRIGEGISPDSARTIRKNHTAQIGKIDKGGAVILLPLIVKCIVGNLVKIETGVLKVDDAKTAPESPVVHDMEVVRMYRTDYRQ